MQDSCIICGILVQYVGFLYCRWKDILGQQNENPVFFRCTKLREKNLMVKTVARRLLQNINFIGLSKVPSENPCKNHALLIVAPAGIFEFVPGPSDHTKWMWTWAMDTQEQSKAQSIWP